MSDQTAALLRQSPDYPRPDQESPRPHPPVHYFFLTIRLMLPLVLIIAALILFSSQLSDSHLFPSLKDILRYFKTLSKNRNAHESIHDEELYGLMVALATVACLPVTPFEIAAGFLFKWKALLIALPGKVAGCWISFWIGRLCWGSLLKSWLSGSPIHGIGPRSSSVFLSSRLESRRTSTILILSALQRALKRNEWKFVLLLRAMYLPQWMKNYGVSVLDIRGIVFMTCTALVSAIYSIAFTIIGIMSDDLINELKAGSVFTVVIVAVGLMIGIFGAVWLSSMVKAELNREVLDS